MFFLSTHCVLLIYYGFTAAALALTGSFPILFFLEKKGRTFVLYRIFYICNILLFGYGVFSSARRHIGLLLSVDDVCVCVLIPCYTFHLFCRCRACCWFFSSFFGNGSFRLLLWQLFVASFRVVYNCINLYQLSKTVDKAFVPSFHLKCISVSQFGANNVCIHSNAWCVWVCFVSVRYRIFFERFHFSNFALRRIYFMFCWSEQIFRVVTPTQHRQQ